AGAAGPRRLRRLAVDRTAGRRDAARRRRRIRLRGPLRRHRPYRVAPTRRAPRRVDALPRAPRTAAAVRRSRTHRRRARGPRLARGARSIGEPGACAGDDVMPQTISLSLVSHTNVGKTTLARTLLGRDVGTVRDEAHV